MRDGLEAGDIIEMCAIADRGILVEKTWTLATYIADMDYQFGYYHGLGRRAEDQVAIWKIFWFKRPGAPGYNIGYYSDKALRESIKCGKIVLYKKPCI
jgi:hypothetical protein|tara:strand:- start:853 stop:1146 length:294 start_codon:yes stop_codon:yes gene_type:complete